MASKNTQGWQRTWSVYKENQPIFFGVVNTMADVYVLAYAHRASVRGHGVENSGNNSVYIREDHPSDDGNWPDALP
jgi:hypothetical protein